jgi:hypothetical protein
MTQLLCPFFRGKPKRNVHQVRVSDVKFVQKLRKLLPAPCHPFPMFPRLNPFRVTWLWVAFLSRTFFRPSSLDFRLSAFSICSFLVYFVSSVV